MNDQPIDMTKFAERSEFQMNAAQLNLVREVFNLGKFHNNSVILGQINYDGIVRVQYLSPLRATVILIALRILGVKP